MTQSNLARGNVKGEQTTASSTGDPASGRGASQDSPVCFGGTDRVCIAATYNSGQQSEGLAQEQGGTDTQRTVEEIRKEADHGGMSGDLTGQKRRESSGVAET